MKKYIHWNTKKILAGLVMFGLIVGLTGACGTGGQKEMQEWEKMPAKIQDGSFCLADENGEYMEIERARYQYFFVLLTQFTIGQFHSVLQHYRFCAMCDLIGFQFL